MLGFLFRRLTAEPERGAELFAALTGEARRPHWYVEGRVPDTLDGRFAMLATIAALMLVRLEQLGDDGNAVAVALTERFIEVMESEHRELGLGDPTLGRTVRKLVGALARRTELWRDAVDGRADGRSGARKLYQGRRSRRRRCAMLLGAARLLVDARAAERRRSSSKGGWNDRQLRAQLRLDQIRDGERIDLIADEEERAGHRRAARAGSIDRLEAHATLSRTGESSAPGPARRVAGPKLRRHR